MESTLDSWSRNVVVTYVLLKPNTNIHHLQSSIAHLISQRNGYNKSKAYSATIYLQPLTGIHLGRGVPYHIYPIPNTAYASGNAAYVWLFVALALFILLLASINYINLSTARSSERAREVGIRKTLGAGRLGIARQFIGEATITCVVSLLLAFIIVQLVLPVFNHAIGAHLSLAQMGSWLPVLILIGLMILLIAFSCSYPALLLSGFTPRSVFQSEQHGGGGRRLRKGLVVFQFSVAVVLIVATIVVYQQLNHIRTASLGFNKEQVVLVKNLNKITDAVQQQNNQNVRQEVKSRFHFLKTRIGSVQGVKNVSLTFSAPSQIFISQIWYGVGANNTKNQMHYSFVDADYLKTLGIQLIAGRNFSNRRSDSLSVIINKSAANIFFGSVQKAVGKKIALNNTTFDVIGIVKNFHYRSLRHRLNPVALIYNNGGRRVRELAVKLKAGHIQPTLSRLKQTWQKLEPNLPLASAF